MNPTPVGDTQARDLLFTNDTMLFPDLEVSKTSISDHIAVVVCPTCSLHMEEERLHPAKDGLSEIYDLKLHFDLIKKKWKMTNEMIAGLNWEDVFKENDVNANRKIKYSEIEIDTRDSISQKKIEEKKKEDTKGQKPV